MFVNRITLVAFVVSIVALGCKTNSNYCPGANANHNCSEIDAAPDPSCHMASDCTAPTGVCDLSGGAGKCVQCTAAEHSACLGTTPICGTDNACRRCTAHSECEGTEVCLFPTGECSNGTDTAYVEANKNGTQCTQADPCPTITAALGKKPYIKVTGAIHDSVSLESRTEKILAAPGAMLVSNGDVAIEARGTSVLEIYGLAITNPRNGGTGISMPTGNHSIVSLHRATVSNCEGGGIVAGGGTLNITQSTLSGNAGGGVKADGGGTLNITQSTLSGNAGGGVKADGGGTLNITRSEISNNHSGGIAMNGPTSFRILNNFITGNGNLTTSDVGGIEANPKDGTSKLEFNTIAGNLVNPRNDTAAGGVKCTVEGFTYDNNILYQNGDRQKLGLCSSGNSFLQIDLTDPKFRSRTDYHLTAETPAPAIRDAYKASECAGNDEDFDGDQRPQGGGCDLGADEYVAP